MTTVEISQYGSVLRYIRMGGTWSDWISISGPKKYRMSQYVGIARVTS